MTKNTCMNAAAVAISSVVLGALCGFGICAIENFTIEKPTPPPTVVEQKVELPSPTPTKPAEISPVRSEPVSVPEWYTEEDVVALAKMVWGEARGVPELVTSDGRVISSKAQQAATMWCVLNRYDAGYADSIMGVITAKNQFVGYSKSHPATDEFIALARDVLERWVAEKNGAEDVGRTLPGEYMFFSSHKGYNRFRIEFSGTTERWDWTLEDVYGGQDAEKDNP